MPTLEGVGRAVSKSLFILDQANLKMMGLKDKEGYQQHQDCIFEEAQGVQEYLFFLVCMHANTT